MTERHVADIVRRLGPISRASLTDRTGLSQATVHRSIERLAELQVVDFSEAATTGPGKPSPMVAVKSASRYSFGLCVNTDAVMLSLVDLRGAVELLEEVTAAANDPAELSNELGVRIPQILRDRSIHSNQICGIGVSMPGFRNGKPNTFQTPRPLKAWRGISVDTFFKEATGLECYVENNGACGALAELFAGHGVQDRSFGYLSFNFGFGGGIVLDGTVIRGARGNAGEIGKVYTNDQMGHRPALGELLQRLASKGIHVERISELQDRFDPDWPGVSEWIAEVTPYLDLAVRAITAVVDPNFIVLGGEAPRALKQMLLDASSKSFVDRWGRDFPMPDLKSSDIQGDPALLGAAFLVVKNRVFL